MAQTTAPDHSLVSVFTSKNLGGSAGTFSFMVKPARGATGSAFERILDKGRGLRRWWERDIGGLNVGFDADPVEDRVAVGDAEYHLLHDGTDP
jgi:hypothetical protein